MRDMTQGNQSHIIKNLVQASLGHTEIRMTQRYVKTVALLSPDMGEKTFSALFKDSQL